jgi:hypothetical protein
LRGPERNAGGCGDEARPDLGAPRLRQCETFAEGVTPASAISAIAEWRSCVSAQAERMKRTVSSG